MSDVHSVEPQRPPSQTPVQHSIEAPQDSPGLLQVPSELMHAPRSASQLAEQQSLWASQLSPTCASEQELVPPLPPDALPPVSPAVPPIPIVPPESVPPRDASGPGSTLSSEPLLQP